MNKHFPEKLNSPVSIAVKRNLKRQKILQFIIGLRLGQKKKLRAE